MIRTLLWGGSTRMRVGYRDTYPPLGGSTRMRIGYRDTRSLQCMSGEAAKERATAAYARVPSKSKLLASELPNMETFSSI